jgi:hypothetical protein
MLDTIETVRELTALDRCDRCGAQAYYVAEKNDQDIMFCAHHAKEHGPALMAQDWKIVRDQLADNLDPQPGASD